MRIKCVENTKKVRACVRAVVPACVRACVWSTSRSDCAFGKPTVHIDVYKYVNVHSVMCMLLSLERHPCMHHMCVRLF